jgi:DNA-binding MarR family transcriptional regulator
LLRQQLCEKLSREMASENATDLLNEEELAAWRAFLRAHSTMLRRISADLDEAGLPPLAWYDVLAALRDAPDHRLRQVELAERVLLSTSGLSRLLDRIEENGLAQRTSCETDRRSFYIELTDEGATMLERMWPVYARGIADDFLPALGSNPCEIRQTLEAIGRQCDAAREAERTARD